MDEFRGKRAVGWISALRKGSSPATRVIDGSRDEATEFCNRLGCSGRLNHTKYTRNKFLERPKPLTPSSRSSVINVRKPVQESRKKLSSKAEASSTNSSSISDESEIRELDTSASSHAKFKSKSRDTESNKARSVPVGRTVDGVSSNTRTRKIYGQSSGLANQDAQIASFDGGRRRQIVKKGSSEGETSSSGKGKKINGASSVRTRRSPNVDLSTRCIHPLHGNNPSAIQSTSVTPNMPQTETCWLSEETSSNGSNPNGSSPVASTDHHRSGRYNVDAIANVLLALERIEQDEELTYEHILSLEANSLLRGFNFYDQHRDMRLDIDNMSYEELLALEERMGTVSTALSEEEISKNLRISIYKPLHMRSSWCLDDTKCSICQEEFVAGDEVGRLECDHGYHAACINQWLRLKNWCPICKALAKPSDYR